MSPSGSRPTPAPTSQRPENGTPPCDASVLVVDLDGSLLATDVLWESLLLLLKKHPLACFLLPLWLLQGRAVFKRRLAERVTPDPAVLPYREEVLAYVRQARASGRDVVLATATDRLVAERIAAHCGLFSAVVASDGRNNLKGARKLQALRAHLGAGRPFDYIGDSEADVPLWEAAARSLVVGRAARRARRLGNLERVFEVPPSGWRAYAKALRVHQWVKNLLVFLPLLLAHRVTEPELLLRAVLAFGAFSLTASGVYVLNDLLDLSSDRQHVRKRLRPFASGALPIREGVLLAPLLLVAGFLLSALLLPQAFTLLLVGYLGLTTAYSFFLKRVALADVLLLAGLYTLRIFAGGAAVDVPISRWLIGFSMFFFLSLAFLKRYAELVLMKRTAGRVARGRGYEVGDRAILRSLGSTSGYLSVVIFALYINGSDVTRLYDRPEVLWLIGPVLLFWISRMWLLAHRGQMHDDPIVFTIKDRVSYVVGAVAAVLALLAILL